MSEKIYALLLRLYPSHFRETYGDEALQLFRDRSRHERGFSRGLRLWLDLFADLAISLPRQHYYRQPVLAGTTVTRAADGTPAFHVLESELPRLDALLMGSVLSLMIAGAWVSIGRLEHFFPPRASARQTQPLTSAPWYQRLDVVGNIGPEKIKLNTVEQHRVIQAAAANLKQHYVDPQTAQKAADTLITHEKNGDYARVTDTAAFADMLTKHMRDVSHDPHLAMIYSKEPLPDRPTGPTPEGLTRYRMAMEKNNCTFEKIEILPHNIGYLKLNSFPDASVCLQTAVGAMSSLNLADAVIFDLRDNRGGFPNMVALMSAYLYDHPEYLYNPRENTTRLSWTKSPVPGNRLADKPVYVLTSARTLSGAEQFCYSLKMLKRATLVGETTGGSAHPGSFHRIGDHLGMGIPETKAINPYSETDWEGIGVEPDVKVNAAAALERARQLAEARLRKNP